MEPVKSIEKYIQDISNQFARGNATEHTYRGDLKNLLESLHSGIEITNEPRRISCGAPDYVLMRNSIPLGYIEAKDVDISLNSNQNKEQFDRYKSSLDNLIITNYLDFDFFENGQQVDRVSIGKINAKKILPVKDNFDKFIGLMQRFTGFDGQTITSTTVLSKMMAQKAKLLAQVIEQSLIIDETNGTSSSLSYQYQGFKKVLIHDIKVKEFADVYAQTITYGMFAARLHDTDLKTFSRQEAATLIPKSNPFLRGLFDHISGVQIDIRIAWMVDAIAEMFRAVDLHTLLKDFSQKSQQQDPIIHFYEDFLAEYDPNLRKIRGVWYTPEAVVKFIVRGVDDVLKTEFKIKDGLACADKTTISLSSTIVDGRTTDGLKKVKQYVHKVQILDPATGTGTFLAETIKHIYQNKKAKNDLGSWNSYVDEHLIPRLNGFEILMVSYAMAHLKLDMLLQEYGYKAPDDKDVQRFRIFLTNSLEEYHPDTGTIFINWLSNEANEANYVKRDTPVMVVMGNPPYSGHSANKGEWIRGLIEDYKQEPSGGRLQERNPKWLNDDYVKFIRYAQYFVEKTKAGVLAYINNHSFLDNPTFRGMRYNLLQTFDKIYILDLHGNTKKKESCPDGSKDENVFDIQQGVSINIFIKAGAKKVNPLAEVYHQDVYGLRDDKYNYLQNNNLDNIKWVKLEPQEPQYFFVPKNFDLFEDYKQGFEVNKLFTVNSVGIVTSRDGLVIDANKQNLTQRMKDVFTGEKHNLLQKYKIKENKTWGLEKARTDAKAFADKFIQPIAYRPFDNRYVYFENNFIERMRGEVMQHFIKMDNVGLCFSRGVVGGYNWNNIQIIDKIVEFGIMASRIGNAAPICPLYLYHDNLISEPQPNLDNQIVTEFCKGLGLPYEIDGMTVSDKNYPTNQNQITPLNILDYIYAVLHSPSYRQTYSEFLKIDFPRVPYPQNVEQFWQLVKLGSQLRQVHLLQSDSVNGDNIKYPEQGDDVVDKPVYKDNQVWINSTQYFANVPETAWTFYIGGYQPAQKWLKDRKGKQLAYDDLEHYKKMISALMHTHEIMQQLDDVLDGTFDS